MGIGKFMYGVVGGGDKAYNICNSRSRKCVLRVFVTVYETGVICQNYHTNMRLPGGSADGSSAATESRGLKCSL